MMMRSASSVSARLASSASRPRHAQTARMLSRVAGQQSVREAAPAAVQWRQAQQAAAQSAVAQSAVAQSAGVRFQAAQQWQARGMAGAAPSTFLPVDEVTERVITVIKAFEKVDEAKVTAEAHFANDIGLDSLDAVEVLMALEEEFVIEIPDDVAEKILTCQDAIQFIASHPQSK